MSVQISDETRQGLRRLSRQMRADAQQRQEEADRRLRELNDEIYAKWVARQNAETLAAADEIDAKLAESAHV